MANIILLVHDSAHAGTGRLQTALQGLGHSVTVAEAQNHATQDFDAADLVLLSRIGPAETYAAGLVSAIRAQLDGGKPVGIGLTDFSISGGATNVAIFANLVGLTGLGTMSNGGIVNEIEITDNTEPPTSGFSLGNLQVYTGNNFNGCVASMTGTVLAVGSADDAGTDGLPALGIVEAGTSYNGGSNTTGARAFLYSALYAGQSGYTANGSALLANLVTWALTAGIAPQDATQGHTATAPAVTQTTADGISAWTIGSTFIVGDPLPPAAATQGHTATAVVLDVPVGLAPQDAAQGHTATSPALVQTYALAPQDAAQGHTTAAPALTQTHALAPQDATEGHAATTVALTVAVAPQDGAQGHTAADITLTVGIAPQDGAQGHEAGDVTLTVGIAPQAAIQGHTTPDAAVAPQGTALPAAATQGHESDSVSLTITYLLAPQAGTQGHAATAPAVTLPAVIEPQDATQGHAATDLSVQAFAAPGTTPRERTFTVPPENRLFRVSPEDRTFRVPPEQRRFVVPPRPGAFRVPSAA